jgi:hypothetical protein
LRQLRDGYTERPKNFPLSVGLIGLRDERDYKVASGGSVRAASPQENRLNTASPFNIKVRSLTLRDLMPLKLNNYTNNILATRDKFLPLKRSLKFEPIFPATGYTVLSD